MKLRTMCSLISCVFWLVICVKCASSIVPAPVNVSVVCNNFQTVVSWTYSQQLLDPHFRVYVSPMPTSQGRTEGNVTTRDLQYNLSGDVWKSFMSSRDLYMVYVSAVSNNQESMRSTSPRFSFNELHRSMVQILCTLDLPPVELLVNDQVATISFPNPMKIHPELHWAADIEKSDPLSLIFDVTEYNVTHRGKCDVHMQTCALEFSLPSKKEKHCFSLNAWLENYIYKMIFNQKDPICGRPKVVAGTYWLFLAVLLTFFILVVCGVGFMVWKSKACFKSSPSLPTILDPTSWPNLQKNIMDTQSEMVCFLSACGQSPSVVITQRPSDPAHSADGLNLPDDQKTPSVDLSSEGPGFSCPGAEYCARSEGSEEDPEGGEAAEVEEVPVPDYDRAHFPCLDMGDGDMVWGYGL